MAQNLDTNGPAVFSFLYQILPKWVPIVLTHPHIDSNQQPSNKKLFFPSKQPQQKKLSKISPPFSVQ
jgi:hypothetical protein